VRAVETAKAKWRRARACDCAGIAPSERIAGRNGPLALKAYACDQHQSLGTFNMLPLAASAMVGNEPMADGERGGLSTRVGRRIEGQIGQVA